MKTEPTDANWAGLAKARTPLATALLRFAENRRTSWHMPGHDGGFLLPEWLNDNLSAIDATELPETDDLNRPEGPAREAMVLAAAAFGAGATRFITTGSTTAIQIMLALAVGRRGRLLVSRCCHQSVIHAAAMLDLDIRFLPATGYPAGSSAAGVAAGSSATRYPAGSQAAGSEPLQQELSLRLALLPQSTPADVAQAIRDNPGCRAVLLTSPDYYGSCADIRQIARLVHDAGALLLVDEAHGAHLAFCPDLLPESAMAAGADACVQSGHKTLPVLTQGAYLHVSADALSSGRLDRDDLERLIPVFQTSSPSFPIAATLDYARAYLSACGDRLVRQQKEFHAQFAASLPAGWICQPWLSRQKAGMPDQEGRPAWRYSGDRDPMRLILTVRDPELVCHVREQADRMSAAGIDIEFSDLTRLVLIPSLEQAAASWQQLTDILTAPIDGVSRTMRQSATAENRRKSAHLLMLENTWRYLLTEPPEQVVSPGDALFGMDRSSFQPAEQLAYQPSFQPEDQPADQPTKQPAFRTKSSGSGRSLRRVPLAESAGCIAAAAILPYPPGIPLIWPGERLDQMRVDFLSELLENRTSISGIVQGKLLVLT